MKAFYEAVDNALVLDWHELLQLDLACSAFDRADAAREVLEKEGLTFSDRFGQPRPRPEAQIEHTARLDFAKLCRDAGLSDPERMLRELEDG